MKSNHYYKHRVPTGRGLTIDLSLRSRQIIASQAARAIIDHRPALILREPARLTSYPTKTQSRNLRPPDLDLLWWQPHGIRAGILPAWPVRSSLVGSRFH